MSRISNFGLVLRKATTLVRADDRGAQLAEFAISLPLLVVFVVGIFDFSGAYTLKQKLTNIAESAARTAAADPSSDLVSPSTAQPASVLDTYDLIHNYLIANNMNDCGITSTAAPVGLTWTFTGNGGGCPAGGITIVVNRGYYFDSVAATAPTTNCSTPTLSGQTAVLATCVSISYAYRWQFGRAASLLGRSIILPNTINASAIAMNEH
jgi:Flp pilus assembly protein TadG